MSDSSKNLTSRLEKRVDAALALKERMETTRRGVDLDYARATTTMIPIDIEMRQNPQTGEYTAAFEISPEQIAARMGTEIGPDTKVNIMAWNLHAENDTGIRAVVGTSFSQASDSVIQDDRAKNGGVLAVGAGADIPATASRTEAGLDLEEMDTTTRKIVQRWGHLTSADLEQEVLGDVGTMGTTAAILPHGYYQYQMKKVLGQDVVEANTQTATFTKDKASKHFGTSHAYEVHVDHETLAHMTNLFKTRVEAPLKKGVLKTGEPLRITALPRNHATWAEAYEELGNYDQHNASRPGSVIVGGEFKACLLRPVRAHAEE